MPGVQENFRNLHHHIFSAGIGIAGLYFTVRLIMDIFNIIMHCLVFHVFPERRRLIMHTGVAKLLARRTHTVF